MQNIALWDENPYRLVTWWEMEKFAAEKFCNICGNLAGLSGDVLKINHFPEDKVKKLVSTLVSVQGDCRQIGLEVSARQFQATIDELENHASTGLLHSVQISQAIIDLGNAISCEMGTKLFLRVLSERVPYYEQDDLFGADVATNFPSAKCDIKSAGSCYACDRNTACVMHLMRVLEVGLNTLAAGLGVPFDRRNWDTIINEIEKEIEKINGPHAGPDWKQKQQFYAGAAKDFRYFKDAWRNNAMHHREHYEASGAKTILDHVKSFMMQLAKGGLKE